MNLISEVSKIDVALVPQTITNTNVTGRYFPMKDFFKAMAVLQVGAMAATKVVTLELWGGSGPAGTGGALITGATATIAANVLVSKATIVCGTVLDGETIVINGLTFKGDTDTTTPAAREFSIAGDDTADAALLAGLINDETYGVPGVVATANTGTVTLVATEPGETLLTIVPGAAKYTVATLEAQAYVEIDGMDLTAGFDHVAAKVTSTATGIVSVLLLREPRNSAVQKVGASAAV
jgi:hypothetical protein